MRCPISVRNIKSFQRDQSGGIALMFGLMVFVLLLAGGGNLDFGITQARRTRLQAALDAAALAAAKDPGCVKRATRV